MIVPLAFPGFIAYLISEKKEYRIFYVWYLPGLIFTMLAHFATDTGILSVSASYMIAAAASILLICQAVKEQVTKKSIVFLVVILFAMQFITCVWQRVTSVWGDDILTNLTYEMPSGPMKGIRTTEENAKSYLDVMKDIDELEMTQEDRLLVLGVSPWIYLYTDAECGAYSTWEMVETDPLLVTYYQFHPEKMPTVIYCHLYDETFLETSFAQKFMDVGYEVMYGRQGIVLKN